MFSLSLFAVFSFLLRASCKGAASWTLLLGSSHANPWPLLFYISAGQRTICLSVIAVHFSGDATPPASLQEQTEASQKCKRQKGKREERAREYRNHIHPSVKYFLLGLSGGKDGEFTVTGHVSIAW